MVDLTDLTILSTKPRGKVGRMLAEKGINLLQLEEDYGNVDRYIISKRLAIERRTGTSFVQGIKDKSLFTSALYMRENFDIPILIVEGEVDYEYSIFPPQALRGALSSMMVLYFMNVLYTPDLKETVRLITMIARHEQIGIPDISLVPKRPAIELQDMQKRIIEMLPGCSMVLARELLHYFGSVKRIVNATEKELRRVRGIGLKKAAEIYKVLNADYESVDTEKNLEDALEADPTLLCPQPVNLLARQHYIFSKGDERHIVDLIFFDPTSKELIFVELKRGELKKVHEGQLLRYMDNANKSELIKSYLDKGMKLRGVLATVDECDYMPKSSLVDVQIVDKDHSIRVLKQLREKRWREENPV